MSRRTVLAAGFAMLVSSVWQVGGQQIPSLFNEAAVADVPKNPTSKRTRAVTVTMNSFDIAPSTAASGRSVEFNLFEDARFVADLRRTAGTAAAGGVVTWTGELRAQPGSQVTLTDRGGVVAANIRTSDGRAFQIRYSGSGGTHLVHEVDETKMPQEGQPRRVPKADVPPGPAAKADPAPTCKDDNTLDVMVAYTPAVRQQFGGTTGVNALIDLGLAETNQGFEASQVAQRIRIVHRAEIAYDESVGFNQTLTDLTGNSDGKMDQIHKLRDQHKSDLVSLWINNSSLCGLAWLMTSASPAFAPNAFSVVHAGCATGYYSFAHEMGHNLGAEHDRNNAEGAGAFQHSFCLQNSSQKPFFRTIMAYACGNATCPRINLWSNPAVKWEGIATGIKDGSSNSADNHLTLEKTRSVAARWRCSAQ